MLKFIKGLFGGQATGPGAGPAGGEAAASTQPQVLEPAATILSFPHLAADPGALRGNSSRLEVLVLNAHAEAHPPGESWAAVVLEGALSHPFQMSRGDLVTGNPDGPLKTASSGALLLVDRSTAAETSRGPRRITRDDLVGNGIKGISGIRVLDRSAGRAILRLGPPPGARWTISGVRALALFSGKLILFDSGEAKTARENSVILSNPRSPLYLQAGNDSAVGLAFADPDVSVSLG